jgi:hypothetical protein
MFDTATVSTMHNDNHVPVRNHFQTQAFFSTALAVPDDNHRHGYYF